MQSGVKPRMHMYDQANAGKRDWNKKDNSSESGNLLSCHICIPWRVDGVLFLGYQNII